MGKQKSGQNNSSAVMNQRIEPHDSLDDFPTPPWATRALIEKVLIPKCNLDPSKLTCWEPCCNRGFMVRPLQEYFGSVFASDIEDYGWSGQEDVWDFLLPDMMNRRRFDWFIFNSPFRLAQQFIEQALSQKPQGVASLVRTSFLEGDQRYRELFSTRPPSLICQYVERVTMLKGRVDPDVSSATAYCWLVWWPSQRITDPKFIWIPKCKQELERESDYEQPR